MSDKDWLELDERALATIQLFLTREVLREVIHEATMAGIWLKLESIYMTKSLANKLRLKDRLYTFRMKPVLLELLHQRQASMIPSFGINAWVTWVRKKRVSFSPSIHRTKDALDYIHSDLWGPSPVTSRGAKRHCRKDERTIMEKVRCMLSNANLDKDFWVEAATTVAYLINRSPHRSFDGNILEILWSDVIINSGKDFVPPYNVDNNQTEDDGNMPTSPQSQPQTEYLLARDRERQKFNRPPRLEDYQCDLVAYAFAAAAHIENCEPINYLEAISSPECDKWVVAMEEEVKDGISGVESNRYKARYVFSGFGIDVNEVLSLVVLHTYIRVLLSIVALQDLELEQLDVKTAFLH
nr:retrovirus-related Pol polyprotein from transposon TNT 1-94 [Tanacetum cinerariifolium]